MSLLRDIGQCEIQVLVSKQQVRETFSS